MSRGRALRAARYDAVLSTLTEDGRDVVTILVDNPSDPRDFQLVTMVPTGRPGEVAQFEAEVHAVAAATGSTVLARFDTLAELEAFRARDRGVGRA